MHPHIIRNNTNAGFIYGNDFIGGIVGHNGQPTITNSVNIGVIKGVNRTGCITGNGGNLVNC